MRLGTFYLVVVLGLGLSACMKKASRALRGINPGPAAVFNPMTPQTYQGAECPNGLQITVTPPTGNIQAQSAASFSVSVTGCKYGYDIQVESGSTRAAMLPTTYSSDPNARRYIPYTHSFSQTFPSAGLGTVRVSIFPRVSDSVPSYTQFFYGTTSVTVVGAPTYTCAVEPALFSVPANSTSVQRNFYITSTAPSSQNPQITNITGGTTTPTTPITLSANAVLVTLTQPPGAIQFTVSAAGVQSVCSSQAVPVSTNQILGNFSGEFPSSKMDHFYLVPNPSGGRDIMMDYVDINGRYVTTVLSAPLALADIPDSILAGDVDADGKDDVLLYKAGVFKWMKSTGRTGFAPISAFSPPWPANMLLTDFSFVPAANGSSAMIRGTLGGQTYYSTISITDSITGSTAGLSAPQQQVNQGQVTLSLNSTSLSGANTNAILGWSGTQVTNCELRKCSWSSSGGSSCTPNQVDQTFASGASAGSTITVSNLSESYNFQMRCNQGQSSQIISSAVVDVFVAVPNTCPISSLVLSGSKSPAAAGAQTLSLGTLSMPADMTALDLRVATINIDDNNPNLLINGQSALKITEGNVNAHPITGRNDQIASFVATGVNNVQCVAVNKGGPSSCTVHVNGSYKTYGGCVVDLKQSHVVGNIDRMESNVLYGWACQAGSANPPPIHLYIGGSNLPSFYRGAFTANLVAPSGVSGKCGVNGVAYGFSIDLNPYIATLKGQRIYVYGINSNLALNVLLGNSGRLMVPLQ